VFIYQQINAKLTYVKHGERERERERERAREREREII
jgi:hypothetical protein